MVGKSNNDIKFPQELLLTNRQVAKLLLITHQLILNCQKSIIKNDTIRRISW